MAAESPEKRARRNGYSSASMLTSSLAGYHLITNSSLIATNSFKVKVTLRLTVGQSVSQPASLGVEPHLGLMTIYLLLFDIYSLFIVGHHLWWEDRSVFCQGHHLQQ
jgi:hypothetical protein